MVEDLSARVKAANTHMRNRLKTEITYSRFKERTYDPETGYVKTYWETPTFDCIVLSVKSSEINSSGGRLKSGDCSFSFPVSEFTLVSGTTGAGGTDPVEPQVGDEIVYGSDTWNVELETDDALWKKDATGTLFQVYARRRG